MQGSPVYGLLKLVSGDSLACQYLTIFILNSLKPGSTLPANSQTAEGTLAKNLSGSHAKTISPRRGVRVRRTRTGNELGDAGCSLERGVWHRYPLACRAPGRRALSDHSRARVSGISEQNTRPVG